MQTKLPDQMKMFLINRLSEIEYRLAQGCNERVQASSFVGAFIEVRTLSSWNLNQKDKPKLIKQNLIINQ